MSEPERTGGDYRPWIVSNVDGGPLIVRMPNGKEPWLIVGESVEVVPATEVEPLREALRRIERLKDRWDAPLRHPAGDMRDPAYAGAAAWAAVGSEAHKIAADALAVSSADTQEDT